MVIDVTYLAAIVQFDSYVYLMSLINVASCPNYDTKIQKWICHTSSRRQYILIIITEDDEFARNFKKNKTAISEFSYVIHYV